MSGSPTSGSPTWWDLSHPLHWVPTFHWFQPSPSSSFLGQKKIFPLQIFPSFSFSVSSPPPKNTFLLQIFPLFIGPESNHWLCLSVSNWLTPSCLVNLIDVTLACEDANSKLVEVVTVADVRDEDRVCCRFGSWGLMIKLNFCSDFEHFG